MSTLEETKTKNYEKIKFFTRFERNAVLRTMASAQCNGTISSTGSGATYSFTSTNVIVPGNSFHSWDFGDGTYGSGQTASHTYTTSGNYTVLAIYADSLNGCVDYDTLIITATAPLTCNAAFTIAGNSPSFTFTPAGTPTAPP